MYMHTCLYLQVRPEEIPMRSVLPLMRFRTCSAVFRTRCDLWHTLLSSLEDTLWPLTHPPEQSSGHTVTFDTPSWAVLRTHCDLWHILLSRLQDTLWPLTHPPEQSTGHTVIFDTSSWAVYRTHWPLTPPPCEQSTGHTVTFDTLTPLSSLQDTRWPLTHLEQSTGHTVTFDTPLAVYRTHWPLTPPPNSLQDTLWPLTHFPEQSTRHIVTFDTPSWAVYRTHCDLWHTFLSSLQDTFGNVRFGRRPVIGGVSRDVTSWFAYAEEWARQVC